MPFDRPVQRTRETIEIVKMITASERVSYDGAAHRLPLLGGHGRAIRSRAETAPIPIYVASLQRVDRRRALRDQRRRARVDVDDVGHQFDPTRRDISRWGSDVFERSASGSALLVGDSDVVAEPVFEVDPGLGDDCFGAGGADQEAGQGQ